MRVISQDKVNDRKEKNILRNLALLKNEDISTYIRLKQSIKENAEAGYFFNILSVIVGVLGAGITLLYKNFFSAFRQIIEGKASYNKVNFLLDCVVIDIIILLIYYSVKQSSKLQNRNFYQEILEFFNESDNLRL